MTLEDLERELARQDAELAACTSLAESLLPGISLDERDLSAFDELFEQD